jgi:hypothetical protein
VKRAVLIVCVLALIIDLTQDGALGQVKPVPAPSPHKSSFSQCKPVCSGQVDSQPKSLLSPLPTIPLRDQSWPAKSVGPQSLKIIHLSRLGSAGGIPL